MHQYTHAWLAFMAIKRLEKKALDENDPDRQYALNLIDWFQNNKDCVIQGAWYPDAVIKDNSTSHILKIDPYDAADKAAIDKRVKKNQVKVVPKEGFKKLPGEYLCYRTWGQKSALRKQAFVVELKTNLPDRCEAFTETVIDHLKMQWSEQKGSPVLPISNQVACLLFMQSHYIADAHMPLHCDGRSFPDNNTFHYDLEEVWEKKVKTCCKRDLTDKNNPRFVYDEDGYPAVREKAFKDSFLDRVQEELKNRELKRISSFFTSSNTNVWDFMSAVCQNTYLVSYHFFAPEKLDNKDNPSFKKWKTRYPKELEDLSFAVLADAADSIARVWLRCWRKVEDWKTKKEISAEKKKQKEKKE